MIFRKKIISILTEKEKRNMNKIDISSNEAIAKTLPSAGKTVIFYDQYGRPFKGCVEFNQWFRPIFYQLIWANDRVRLSWVPSGWDELEDNR